jgi:hypothetical protein
MRNFFPARYETQRFINTLLTPSAKAAHVKASEFDVRPSDATHLSSLSSRSIRFIIVCYVVCS